VPLGQLAEIRFGVKSGADDFFFVCDVTEVNRRFKEKWDTRLADTDRIRVVEAGDGSRHLIEAEYLEPEVHSLMEIDSVGLQAVSKPCSACPTSY